MNVPRGLLRLLLGILAAFLPACAAAQFEVSFSLSKTTYLAGEPVFLSLTVKNVSTEPLQISAADHAEFEIPPQDCSHFCRQPISKSVIIGDVPIVIHEREGKRERQQQTSLVLAKVVHFQRLIHRCNCLCCKRVSVVRLPRRAPSDTPE
jgi:hypothetical protein